MRWIACLLAMSLVPVPARAVTNAVDACRQAPPPPEPWTSWSQKGRAAAGGEAATAPRLILGKPVVATLRPQAQVQYPVKPPQRERSAQGGLFTLALKDPARVGIALSGPAWVDIFTGSTIASAVDHGHGPDCSGIAKIVWFDLPPGLHLVALSGASQRDIRVMAADARANRPVPPTPGAGL
ncbi:hypothetical protein [Sphingobium mellinum]|uniref:hypothetical protein n=1 Tax=Sphingobium mellinum TaxID=1387166 RepID=UPI0030EE6473